MKPIPENQPKNRQGIALMPDAARRGGVRCVSVTVSAVWPLFRSAAVMESGPRARLGPDGFGLAHVVPLSRLGSRGERGTVADKLRAMVRGNLSRTSGPDEKPALSAMPGLRAGARAVEPSTPVAHVL